MKFPTVLLIRGLPGSGKSYLAQSIVLSIGGDRVEVLDPDAIDYESQAYKDLSSTLSGEGVDAKFHPYRFLRARAHQAILDQKLVVWTQAFTNLDGFIKTIHNLESFAAEHDQRLPVVIVEVQVDKSIAKSRIKDRVSKGGHDVSDNTYERFIHDYSSFAHLGYPTVSIKGDNDVSESTKLILMAMNQ
jgi:hypothetical protein